MKSTQSYPFKSTAVLVFANSEAYEAKRKPLLGASKQGVNARIHKTLIEHTQRQLAPLNVPVFWFNEENQQGHTFGARISNAMQALFDKGIENLLVIGADTPNLKTCNLKKALFQLEQGKTVVGPARDGGIYLLGLHQNNFDVAFYKTLPWQCSSLFESIQKQIDKDNNRKCYLKCLSDVDRSNELFAFIRKHSSKVQYLLAQAIQLSSYETHTLISEYKHLSTKFLPARAPPGFL